MGELHALRCPVPATARMLRELWDAGHSVVVLDPTAPAPSVQATLEVLRPAAITEVDDDRSVARRRLPDPDPIDDEVALVVTTSGSTGRPKGVKLTHAALRASTDASLDRLGCAEGDRWALALPTHHVAGIQVLLRAWALGTEPDVVDRTGLATTGAEHVSLVPTQLGRMLDDGVDVARFATILLGGASAAPGLLDRAHAAGARVVASYGMSETAGGCVYDGIPLRGVDVEVVDQRIRVRGAVLFSGYRGDAAATDHAVDGDGWFTTGDLGRIVDGRLEVLGRADDVIVTGGENVAIRTVTGALLAHPAVADAAAAGRADEDWGEIVVAVVVPRDPADPPSLAQLRDHVRAHHPASHAPRALVLVDELPTDTMGKVTRATLRARVG